MPLTGDEIRSEAWDNVVHAQGTYSIFAKRAWRLRWSTDLRDYFGFIAIPMATAFFATTEYSEQFKDFRGTALLVLTGAAVIQALLAGWSLIRRWDEQRAYCLRAMRDSYEIRDTWRAIGKNDVPNLPSAYEMAKAQQKIIDSHDIGAQITETEKIYGRRSGFNEIRRACPNCHKIPDFAEVPLFAWARCSVCGGRT
jgi:mobilome CxxCx(11)CxxC protein